METFSFDVPLLDPAGDFPGPRALSSFLTVYSLANVPKSWPLARLTIPLSAASKHLERLLEGCCMEIFVGNTNPDSQLHFVRKFAKDLVVVFAFHLAETISALFRHVLDHPSKVLYFFFLLHSRASDQALSVIEV